eukprot:TRINITY_DN4554_c1_g1_i1.p1 TRINITY_DN4554_c1_g1~~TRINITY_DN4554_c1_g1_i1.p1  ORF type:complete len:303 (-),score=141.91 TRINITY_DN4554_c1_g1_i1:241-1149(-)
MFLTKNLRIISRNNNSSFFLFSKINNLNRNLISFQFNSLLLNNSNNNNSNNLFIVQKRGAFISKHGDYKKNRDAKGHEISEQKAFERRLNQEVHDLAGQASWRGALGVLEELRRSGVTIRDNTYLIAMKVCFEYSKRFDYVFDVFEHARRDKSIDIEEQFFRFIEPNLAVFKSVNEKNIKKIYPASIAPITKPPLSNKSKNNSNKQKNDKNDKSDNKQKEKGKDNNNDNKQNDSKKDKGGNKDKSNNQQNQQNNKQNNKQDNKQNNKQNNKQDNKQNNKQNNKQDNKQNNKQNNKNQKNNSN